MASGGRVERMSEITQADKHSHDRLNVGKLAVEFDHSVVEFETVRGREHNPIGDERSRTVVDERKRLIERAAIDLRDKHDPGKGGLVQHAATDYAFMVSHWLRWR